MKEKKKNPKGVYEKIPGSGVFWARYADASGKIHREKGGTKGAALKLYQKRKTEVLEGKKLPQALRAKRVTFKELADYTLEYSRIHKRSFRDDKSRMSGLVEVFGNRSAESITPQDIERLLNSWSGTLKPATLNRYRALLCLTFRLAIENGKIHDNPAHMVKQRRENNSRVRHLSDREESTLRAVVTERWYQHLPELVLAIHTALRQGEQYSMEWKNVDFDRQIATIPVTKNGDVKYVSLNPVACAALRMLQTRNGNQHWVFINRYGERMKSPREWFRKALKEAGVVDFRWHDLRHTFASNLAMAGASLVDIQRALGQKGFQMTLRYAHLSSEHQLTVVNKLCDTEVALDGNATDTKTDTGSFQVFTEQGKLVN